MGYAATPDALEELAKKKEDTAGSSTLISPYIQNLYRLQLEIYDASHSGYQSRCADQRETISVQAEEKRKEELKKERAERVKS